MLQVEKKAVIASGGVIRVEELSEDGVCNNGFLYHNGLIHGMSTNEP